MRQVTDRDDERSDGDGHDQTPAEVGEAQGLVRRQRGKREVRLVQPAPARDPGEDDRSGPGRDEPRQERAADLLRGDLPARRGHLEQEKRSDQRASEERSDRRERTGEDEGAGLRFPPAESVSPQAHRDRDRGRSEAPPGRGRARDPVSPAPRGGCLRVRSEGSGPLRALPTESDRRGRAAERPPRPGAPRGQVRG